MRQKKKLEESKLSEQEKQDACVKCSKLQNSGHSSFDETETQTKQTTLSTLKSVLKRSTSHKKDKLNKNQEKLIQKEHQSSGGKKQKNRVQFDESRNKYFEADYVILIHEEDYDLDDYYDEGSPYDDEDDDNFDEELIGQKICCSNPNCNNVISLNKYPNYSYSNSSFVDFKYSGSSDRERFDFSSHYYDVNYEEINQNTKKSSKVTTNRCANEKCQNCNNYFDFEVVSDLDMGQDYGDQVTLSPPEGYKDGGSQCCPHHGLEFHHLVNNGPPLKSAGGARRLEFHEDVEPPPPPPPRQELREEASVQVDDSAATELESSKLETIRTESIDTTDNDMKLEDKADKVKQRFIVETITMTTVTERRIVRESGEASQDDILEEAKRSGILKGGKFWKNSTEKQPQGKSVNYNEVVDYKENENESSEVEEISTSFVEEQTDSGSDAAKDKPAEEKPEAAERPKELEGLEVKEDSNEEQDKKEHLDEAASPESTELTLTFKLGQHVLVANSLKPNSAVRQLFPSPRFLSPPPLPDEDEEGVESEKAVPPKQFLVTAESLRLFEEAKKSKILGNMNSNEPGQSFIAIMPPISRTDEDDPNKRIRRTIERNTLRRSLIKYPCDLRNKRLAEKRKNENSLEERIKQLTCGVDDEEPQGEPKKEDESEMPPRSSPQGEESKDGMPGVTDTLHVDVKNIRQMESASPSSNSSSSSSGGSTYKKITDLFCRKNNPLPILEDVNCNIKNEQGNVQYGLVFNQNNPDLGNESLLIMPNDYASNPHIYNRNTLINQKNAVSRMSISSEARKQFLSTLAPLAACVTSVEGKERLGERYRLIDGRDRFPSPGERISVASSGEETTEYSLDDIDEGLKDEQKKIGIQPDVIAGTPQNETPNDELALFVQQDAGRIEKLKKRYSASDDKSDDDDDYGFNKRPTVKGIKPRFGSTNEIIQQIQSQMPGAAKNPGSHTTWPYYSQENAEQKPRNSFPPKQPEESQYGIYSTPQEYRTYAEIGNANYIEYQNGPQPRPNYLNQSQQSLYSSTNSLYQCQPMRIGGGGYPELSNYQFRHPPHSPPPVRHIMITPQPSPNPSEDGRNRSFDNSSGSFDNSNRSEVGLPDMDNRIVSRHTDGMVRNPDSIFYRRTVPNVHNPCLQMKFSPINYHQGAMPTASIRFSASCSPRPVVDESNVIIEPHYSTLPHPQAQSTVGVIRVGQGQQMIRVPVPYPTGTPVQVHLMAGRVGRCDSPQRPSSPQGVAKGPIQSYNQYLIAKGTQTAQIQAFQIPTKTLPDGAPSDTDSVVDFEAQGKAIAEELQNRQKLSRSMSQEAGYQHARLTQRSSSPVNMKTPHERGVPEGAASSSVQDSQPQATDASHTSGNTIYYSMNV